MNPPDQPTPTPRTDEAVRLYRFLDSGPLELEGRFADFARALECELTAERERVRVLREHGVEALMVARSWQLVWGDRISPDSVVCFTQHEQAFLAALAATEAAK
jgi:hypothetical protein